MPFARTVITLGSILCGSSVVQAFPKSIVRGIASTTLAAMSDQVGCEDGVCRPLGIGNAAPSDLPSKAKASNKIKIDIISDTMCPWCWVGKRNLEKALQEMPEVEVEINWLPFFLDKKLPEEGKPVEEYYVGNYGDPRAGDRMKPGLIAAGRRCGIDFETHYVHLERYRPTIRSHRLISLAKRQNKQDEMVEELFHMFYEEGKHLNSIKHLAEAATKVGLEGNIEAYLKSDEDEKEVFEEAEKILCHAEGVPTFLFTKPGTKLHHSFSGGQPPSAFKQVFSMFSQWK
jgi:predicted DsbA family dithiol-disulfide isomerase